MGIKNPTHPMRSIYNLRNLPLRAAVAVKQNRCHPVYGLLVLILTTVVYWMMGGPSTSTVDTISDKIAVHSSSQRVAVEPDPHSLMACPEQGSPYRLACLQSFGYFQTIHETDWMIEQNRARTAVQHPVNTLERGWFNPAPSNIEPSWIERWLPSLWYMGHYQPVLTCPHVRRVGGLTDGGKWMCDPYRLRDQVLARRENQRQQNDTDTKCLIYSIGSNGNFDFEYGLIDDALGGSTELCEIHVFDFDDFDSPALRAKNIFFHRWGLTSHASHGRGDGGWKQNHMIRRNSKMLMLSFAETQQRLGHQGRAIDIFKIDCESCEWKSYKDWLYQGDIRQILMETHGFPPKPMAPTELFDDFLKSDFIMYSKEPNMIGTMTGAVEWSFIRLHPDFLKDKTDKT